MTVKIVVRFAYNIAELEIFIGKMLKKRWFTWDIKRKKRKFTYKRGIYYKFIGSEHLACEILPKPWRNAQYLQIKLWRNAHFDE